MTYTIKKTDGTILATVPDQTIVTDAADVSLIGRGAVNYGAEQSENIVHMLEHFASDDAPDTPIKGQLWYNTATTLLNVYDGTSWKPLSMGFGSGSTFSAFNPIAIGSTTAIVIIVGGLVLGIISRQAFANALVPVSVSVGTDSYALQSRFPNGITAGLTLATDSADYLFNGHVKNADLAVATGGGTPFGSVSYQTIGATTVIAFMSNAKIGVVFSQAAMDITQLPINVAVNSINYPFATRFPNGLVAGFTFATDTSVTYGISGLATQSDIASLTASINGEITARASADTSLSAQITQNGNSITSIATQITSLNSQISSANGNASGAASAVSTLTAQVSSLNGQVTALSSSNQALSTQVGQNEATVQTFASSINGLEAKNGVTLDVNGYITGYEQFNNGSSGSFIIRADVFKIVEPGANAVVPFSVINGVVYMQTVAVGTLMNNTAVVPARAVASNLIYGTSTFTGDPSVTPVPLTITALTCTVVMPVSGYIEATATMKLGFHNGVTNRPWGTALYVNGNQLPESYTFGTVPGDSVAVQGALYVGAGTYNVTLLFNAHNTVSIGSRSLFVKGYPFTQ